MKINDSLIKFEYSTEERPTHKIWIDGKRIYEKTFIYHGVAISKDISLDAKVTDDLSKINTIDFNCRYKLGTKGEIRPFPTLASNGTALLQARWDENKIKFTGSDNWGGFDDRYLIATLEYTKTQ